MALRAHHAVRDLRYATVSACVTLRRTRVAPPAIVCKRARVARHASARRRADAATADSALAAACAFHRARCALGALTITLHPFARGTTFTRYAKVLQDKRALHNDLEAVATGHFDPRARVLEQAPWVEDNATKRKSFRRCVIAATNDCCATIATHGDLTAYITAKTSPYQIALVLSVRTFYGGEHQLMHAHVVRRTAC